jgi:hypothetical protein
VAVFSAVDPEAGGKLRMGVAWEASALPLSYTRKDMILRHFFDVPLCRLTVRLTLAASIRSASATITRAWST